MSKGRTSSGVSLPVVAKVDTFDVLLTALDADTIKSKSFSLTEIFVASSDMAGGQRANVWTRRSMRRRCVEESPPLSVAQWGGGLSISLRRDPSLEKCWKPVSETGIPQPPTPETVVEDRVC